MNAGNEEGDQPGRYAYMRVAGLMLANPYVLLAFASLCWSGNHIIGRAIAGHVPPIGISTVRWAIPALVLWPIARSHLRRDWPKIKPVCTENLIRRRFEFRPIKSLFSRRGYLFHQNNSLFL